MDTPDTFTIGHETDIYTSGTCPSCERQLSATRRAVYKGVQAGQHVWEFVPAFACSCGYELVEYRLNVEMDAALADELRELLG